MHIALWIASGLLSFAMLGAGGIKLVKPRAKLVERFRWAERWSDGGVKALGLAEMLGAVGLVVPQVTGILPLLTPLASLCLAILMIGAVKTHRDLGEPVTGPGILALLGLFVALGRFALI